MRSAARFGAESLLLFILSGALFVAAVVAAQQIFADEKVRYFVVGYYAAIHADLARWIWRRLRVEKDPPA